MSSTPHGTEATGRRTARSSPGTQASGSTAWPPASEPPDSAAKAAPPIGWWEYDLGSGQVFWDESTRDIYGFSGASGPIPVDDAMSIIHPDDMARSAHTFQSAVEPGGTGGYRIVKRILRRGEVRWVRVVGHVQYDVGPGGRTPRKLAGVVEDVTDLGGSLPGRGETAESELDATYRTAPVGLGVLDLDLRFRRVNERLAEMNGLPAAAHLGRTVAELLPGLAPQAEALLRRVVSTGEPVTGMIVRGSTPAERGMERVWRESWFPLRTGGEIVGVNFVVEDVTEEYHAVEERLRLEAESDASARALSRTESRLRWFVDSNTMGVLFWTLDGSVTFANDAFLDLVGYTREDLEAGRINWKALTPPEWRSADDRAAGELLRSGSITPFEKEYLHRSGRRVPVLINAASFPEAPDEGVTLVADLTERDRAERTAREEARLRRFALEAADLGTWHLDLDTRLSFFDRRAREILGISSAGPVARDAAVAMIHPGDLARSVRELAGAVRPEGPGRFETRTRIVRPDGEVRWTVVSGLLVSDAGHPVRLVGTIRDDTKAHARGVALRAANARLRATLSAAEIGTWEVDLETGAVHASAGADEMLGFPPSSIPRTLAVYLERVHPEDRDRVETMVPTALGDPARCGLEFRICRPDGQERLLVSRCELVRDEQGHPLRVVVALADVTERHRMRRALKEEEFRFRAMADHIPQLAWMADPEGSAFWYNRRWVEYTGYEVRELVARGWGSFLHPEHAQRVEAGLRQACAEGESWEDTFPLRDRHGGYRWFLCRAVGVRDDADTVARWFGTATDVTEQLEAAAERETLLRQAEAANRAKSDFMAVVSHELRTPLNAVLGYSDLMDAGIPVALPPEAREQVRRLRLAALHQRQLIEDLLTFMRLDAGREFAEVAAIDLVRLIDEISAVITPLAREKGLAFEIDLRDAAGAPVSDPRMLRHVLLNLLGNAVKFTDSGMVRLRVASDGEFLRLEVEDTGPGVPESDRAHLFEPFWQGDQNLTRGVGGTGLGLSIAQRFTRLLGGEIRCASVVGEGTTFTVLVPLAE